ncbi:UNKNOWN [Stylonychia lemnae]|uniref:Ion transport domain-containing protein n=1 Tax=Stylonychia lemnae TaxID=5949 RepID=A0A078B2W0_STYLE|nr:UNKNOWN [Stylonychia lemnae]|eukprot:CDW88576.1 UNKNOWN [Stylonychia lemnae]
MKLFFFLRIYEGFSFLVQMLASVFKDLKYFLIFFIIFIIQFGIIFLVLFKAQDIDEYNGMNKLAYFLMAFRISSGDFQLDDFHSQENGLVILTWLIWLIAVMTLYIVFMNFIIAVISESYERVMQKLVAESYRVKANMIVERERFFTKDDLENTKYFPSYIVVRRPLNAVIKEDGEWQGFIKDLKYTIRTTAVKSKADIIQNSHLINRELDEKMNRLNQENSKKLDDQIKGFETKFVGLDTKVDGLDTKVVGLDTKVDGLNTNVLKIQDDMEFLKTSLTQFIQNYKSVTKNLILKQQRISYSQFSIFTYVN